MSLLSWPLDNGVVPNILLILKNVFNKEHELQDFNIKQLYLFLDFLLCLFLTIWYNKIGFCYIKFLFLYDKSLQAA
jgi:hypothetical protein